MTKIRRVNFRQFRNHDFFQCSTEFIDLVEKFEPAKLKIEDLFKNEYRPAFHAVDQAIQKIMKNSFTEAKNEADHRRDCTFRGMIDTNKAALNHFKEDIVKAAKRLKILFDSYGNIAQKSQQEQTSAITNLLQELKGNYKKDAEITGLTVWAEQLDADNKAYETLMKSSFGEDSARVEETARDARRETEKIYNKIVNRIEAFLLIEGAEIHIDFIKQWNAVLEKYDNILAQQQGISKSKKDKEDER